jgi:hypothetical protein
MVAGGLEEPNIRITKSCWWWFITDPNPTNQLPTSSPYYAMCKPSPPPPPLPLSSLSPSPPPTVATSHSLAHSRKHVPGSRRLRSLDNTRRLVRLSG